MSSNTKQRVLVVEDEADIRGLMVMHLEREGYEPVGVDDGEKARSRLKDGKFDLVVLDWMLPGTSGLEICKGLQRRVPVLMVTAKADPSDVVIGLELGADDYVTKPFEIPVFLARVRALLRRARETVPTKAEDHRVGELRLNGAEHRVWCGKAEIKLTASEFKLLQALLEHRGRVLARKALIEQVQGHGINVTDRTIDTHVFGLRKKLGECSDLIETIRGVGYRIEG